MVSTKSASPRPNQCRTSRYSPERATIIGTISAFVRPSAACTASLIRSCSSAVNSSLLPISTGASSSEIAPAAAETTPTAAERAAAPSATATAIPNPVVPAMPSTSSPASTGRTDTDQREQQQGDPTGNQGRHQPRREQYGESCAGDRTEEAMDAHEAQPDD